MEMSTRRKLTRLLSFLLVLLILPGCTNLAYRNMNDPAREVIAALALQQGVRVADLGAGGGYITWRLADAVGSQRMAYTVEIDDTALGIIKSGMQSRRVTNVVPTQAESGS